MENQTSPNSRNQNVPMFISINVKVLLKLEVHTCIYINPDEMIYFFIQLILHFNNFLTSWLYVEDIHLFLSPPCQFKSMLA